MGRQGGGPTGKGHRGVGNLVCEFLGISVLGGRGGRRQIKTRQGTQPEPTAPLTVAFLFGDAPANLPRYLVGGNQQIAATLLNNPQHVLYNASPHAGAVIGAANDLSSVSYRGRRASPINGAHAAPRTTKETQ